MSKRKNDKKMDELYNKIKLIEDELHRVKKNKRRRILSTSESSSTSRDSSPTRPSEPEDGDSFEVPTVEHDDSAMEILSRNQKDSNSTQNMPADDDVEIQGLGVSTNVPGCSTDTVPIGTGPELDAETLEILGLDPTIEKKYGNDIQKDIAIRLEHIALQGLSKNDRKELTEKYLAPGNCKLIDAPQLNPEVKAALSESVVKRDRAIQTKQKVMTSAISGLAEAISTLATSKDKNANLLRLLMDSGRLLCDCQHADTITRRNYVLFGVKPELKEQLQNTKVEDFLFGKNLSETIKTARAINKSGAELKITPAPKPGNRKNINNIPKNWKSPHPARRQPTRTKDPAPAAPATSSTKTQRYSSRPPLTQRTPRTRR